jgi:hypothetical protein
MSFLSVTRTVVFIVTTLFSVIVLALAAHLTSLTVAVYQAYSNPYGSYGSSYPYDTTGNQSPYDSLAYFPFAAMGIATALLTFISLPIFLLVDVYRQGAWTSMIIVEIPTLTFLWVLWLSTAGLTASVYAPLSAAQLCSSVYAGPACGEIQAILAFSFLNWLSLMAYASVLLVFVFIAQARGNPVWTGSVQSTNFFAPRRVQQQQQQQHELHQQVQKFPLQQPMAIPAASFSPQMQMQPQPMFVPGMSPTGGMVYLPGSPVPQTVSPPPMTPYPQM